VGRLGYHRGQRRARGACSRGSQCGSGLLVASNDWLLVFVCRLDSFSGWRREPMSTYSVSGSPPRVDGGASTNLSAFTLSTVGFTSPETDPVRAPIFSNEAVDESRNACMSEAETRGEKSEVMAGAREARVASSWLDLCSIRHDGGSIRRAVVLSRSTKSTQANPLSLNPQHGAACSRLGGGGAGRLAFGSSARPHPLRG
jgi:hypothetical protein